MTERDIAMEREELKFENIKKDLERFSAVEVRRANYLWITGVFIAPVFAIVGLFINKLIAAIFAVIWIYSLINYIPKISKNLKEKKNTSGAFTRDDFSVSVEKLSHISEEIVSEPGPRGDLRHRTVRYYHFCSGISWAEPNVSEHYEWSKDFSLSSKGLSQTSVEGNEFYYITLKGASNAAYIYNTKFFVLKENES